MPHISQKKLKRDAFRKISQELTKTVSELKSKKEIDRFLKELLTDTERIMLAKRLALIMMLKKKISYQAIEKSLKVTPQTIVRYWKRTKGDEFLVITNKLERDKARGEFWDSVERALLVGMPSLSSRQRKRLGRKW